MSETKPDYSSIGRVRRWLLDRTRHQKRAFLAITDFTVLTAGLWLLTSLRYSSAYWPDSWIGHVVYWSGPAITVATFAHLGLYRFVTRYLGTHAHTRVVAGVTISVLVWSLLVFMAGQLGTPRSVILSYGLFAAVATMGIRYIVARFLRSSGIDLPKFKEGDRAHPVLIYGAGQMGVDLAMALRRSRDRDVVGFCDSSPSLWGQYVAGYRVHRPERLGQAIERLGVEEILLAIPSSDRNERRLVLKQLEHFPVKVKVLPSLAELASGKVALADLRPLEIEDLLGRDAVPPIGDLLSRDTTGKCVMVTGAGGSVGSELVRQVLRQAPSRIVLFDVSEPSLYEIGMEVQSIVSLLPEDQRAARRRHGAGLRTGRAAHQRNAAQVCCLDDLSCGSLQARADRRTQRIRRSEQQRTRHGNSCRCRDGQRRRADGAHFHRQGRASDQCHGRQQAACRTRPAGPRLDLSKHRVHDGALWQCAGQLRVGRALLPPADRAGRPRDRHASGSHPLLHVDSRGRRTRDSGGRHGQGRRGVRAGHGRAGQDQRSGAN